MEDKYIVVKTSDTVEHLTESDKKTFDEIIDKIRACRKSHGQENHKYIVINSNEHFARDILTILDNHGHDVLD